MLIGEDETVKYIYNPVDQHQQTKSILKRTKKQSCQVGKNKKNVYNLGNQILPWAEAEII